MQRAGLDQVEVGGQRAELSLVLDPSHQVGMRRMVLDYDGRGIGLAVIDDHVGLVAPERRRTRKRATERRRRAALGGIGLDRHEVLGVLDDVLLDLIEVFENLRLSGPAVAQPVHQMTDGEARHLLIERANLLSQLTLPLGHLLEQRLQLVFELGEGGLDLLLVLLWPLPEDLRAHHLAALDRREGEAHGGADQRRLALAGFLL